MILPAALISNYLLKKNVVISPLSVDGRPVLSAGIDTTLVDFRLGRDS